MRYRNQAVTIISIVTAFLFCGTLNVSADAIKDRMVNRLPTINALKDQGVIGENAQGYLEFRTDSKPEQQLIQEENNDRKSVYAEIAKKQGVAATLVGQRRAQQIAEKGSPGHWFRRPDGSWQQR